MRALERPALLRAKEFAAKAGVTVRTLHFYDRQGLLAPSARTDSGYRLYGEPELVRETTPPEVIEKGERDWAELIAEVEAACKTEDASSAKAQALARRWHDLVRQFTKSDPDVSEGLQKLWTDRTHWPADFKKPYSDEAEEFIRKASAHLA